MAQLKGTELSPLPKLGTPRHEGRSWGPPVPRVGLGTPRVWGRGQAPHLTDPHGNNVGVTAPLDPAQYPPSAQRSPAPPAAPPSVGVWSPGTLRPEQVPFPWCPVSQKCQGPSEPPGLLMSVPLQHPLTRAVTVSLVPKFLATQFSKFLATPTVLVTPMYAVSPQVGPCLCLLPS